ncbi:glycosyltransferase [Limosilactobacillus caccae]|uniref:glycosyltransferase n=1 Tax=Limosilactobacillus caccae TaxID=1926284 RepID=UPI00097113AE|nr:glycosyltransferase [Limosilactobacillus caccae]
MKLKFICAPASGNGGTETVLKKALNHLSKKYQVELYLTTIPVNRLWLDQMKNVKIHEPHSESKPYKLFYLLRIFLTARNSDRFIILGANTINLASKIRKITKKKYMITSWIHYSLINQNMFNPNNITLADNHWAISTPIKKQLMDLGINENKISLIFNPVDQYAGDLNTPDTSDTLRLVYVGKIMLDGQKNLRELFQGIKNYSHPVHLDLFGADSSNGEVQDYVNSIGLNSHCTFHGWTKNPWKIIVEEIHPNALVLTSKYEGLPMVMIEAMSRGIPCLVADFSGYEDIIKKQVNGLVYLSNNTKDLVQKMYIANENKFKNETIANSISKFNSKNYYLRLDQILEKRTLC